MTDLARRQAAEVVLSMTPALDVDVAKLARDYIGPDAFDCEALSRCWSVGLRLLRELSGDRCSNLARIAEAAGVDPLWWQALAARCPHVSAIEAFAIVGRAGEERSVRDALVAGIYMLDAGVTPARVARLVADRLRALAA